MRFPGAIRAARRNELRGVNRSLGLGRHMLHFSASREAAVTTIDTRRLPVTPNDMPLQDPQGNFYFLPGYSDPNGTDIQ